MIATFSLQDGLQSEILARSFGDAVNANAINANTALIALEEDARIDGDSSLAAYDAYLESLILNTAGSVLDVENIIETVDYFDDNGSATINLEGGWTLVDFGTAQIQASTSSFDAVDAQHIDTDDIDVQTIEVESNLVSPAGTIGNLDATTLEVYTTLDVSGETTLGANTSVDVDVCNWKRVCCRCYCCKPPGIKRTMLLTLSCRLTSTHVTADANQAAADSTARAAIQLM